MTLKINVTQKDIDKAIIACQGGTWLTEGCPVAQALMRTFPGSYVNVAFRTLWVDDVKYWASHEVCEFTMSPPSRWPQLKRGSFEITDESVQPTGITRRLSRSDPLEDEYATQS